MRISVPTREFQALYWKSMEAEGETNLSTSLIQRINTNWPQVRLNQVGDKLYVYRKHQSITGQSGDTRLLFISMIELAARSGSVMIAPE